MTKQSKRFLFLQKKLNEIYKELDDIANNAQATGCEHIVETRKENWDSGYGDTRYIDYNYCPVCRQRLRFSFVTNTLEAYLADQ